MSGRFIEDDWDLDHAWQLFAQATTEVDRLITDITQIDVVEDDHQFYNEIQISSLASTCALAVLLADFERSAYGTELVEETQISPTILNKLINSRGSLKPAEATHTIDQFRIVLNRIESDFVQRHPSDSEPKEAGLQLSAEQWVEKGSSVDVRTLISELVSRLEAIIQIFETSNSLAETSGVSTIRMAELRAVMKTALAVLDAPLIERGLIKRAGAIAQEASESFAKDEIQRGLSFLLKEVGDKALELYVKLIHSN